MTTDISQNDTPSINVNLGERSYDILIGSGLLQNAATHIKTVLNRPRTVIITDENVAEHHLAPLEQNLQAADIQTDSIILPAGESSKSFNRLSHLLDDLLSLKLERKDMIIALGGGVIGDLVGFAASIYQRGIDFIQIPTTLLSQVDSSVGGKTGINMPHGKNLVGSFHQPRLVMIDINTLDTLEQRQLLAGYAEVVKYGLLGDAAFFDWLEQHGADLIAGDAAKRIEAIKVSCETKARIVAEDEREGGKRALLNLGHTFGHALEAQSHYSDHLYHGEAVSIGMVQAFDMSANMGLCDTEAAERARKHLKSVGLPVSPVDADHPISGLKMTSEELMEHMKLDKKVSDGKLTFILVRAIGEAFITRDVEARNVKDVLDNSLAI